MVLAIVRGVFVVLVTCVAMLYLLTSQYGLSIDLPSFVASGLIALGLSTVVIVVDVNTKHKKLSALSGVFLGLVAGLLVAYALGFVVDFVGVLNAPELPGPRATLDLDKLNAIQKEAVNRYDSFLNLLQGVKVLIGLITCYLSISLVLQTKDDFRFVLPYVEFAKEIRGTRPTLLDTSVIIDGRILDIVATQLIQGVLVVPRFVLNELQLIADSSDKLRRARGRRGLEILQKLQAQPVVQVLIEEAEAQGATVDQKLVSLAQEMKARVMTNDFNLNKVAQLRGVDVVNLNDLAKALRPVVLPGELMRVKVVKPGEQPGQGVGYLEDGTMVVVDGARGAVGQDIDLVVNSSLQTSAGRMIFGRLVSGGAAEAGGDIGPALMPAPAAPPPAPGDPAAPASDPRPPRQGPSFRNPRRNG